MAPQSDYLNYPRWQNLSFLKEIFVLEIMYRMPQKGYFWPEQNLSQKQVTETETNYLIDTTFCHGKKSLCHKNKFRQRKISFRKQVSIAEPSFCPSFCQWNTFVTDKKFLSKKKVSVTEKNSAKDNKYFGEKIFCGRSSLIRNLCIKT